MIDVVIAIWKLRQYFAFFNEVQVFGNYAEKCDEG